MSIKCYLLFTEIYHHFKCILKFFTFYHVHAQNIGTETIVAEKGFGKFSYWNREEVKKVSALDRKNFIEKTFIPTVVMFYVEAFYAAGCSLRSILCFYAFG